MTISIRVPGDIDVATRLFGRFTWKDLLRVLIPTLGLGVVHPVAAVGGLLIGTCLYAIRPYGTTLDSHAYHAVRHNASRKIGLTKGAEAAEVGGVEVSTTNLELKTDTEQRAILDKYRGLLEQVEFPVQIISRQESLPSGSGTRTRHNVITRVDASHDNPAAELSRRVTRLEEDLTGGEIVADRLPQSRVDELSDAYQGETSTRHIHTKNGEHVRVAAISEHPTEVDLGWVREILRADGKVDIHQVIHPRDPRATEKALEREKESLAAEIGSLNAGGFLGTNRLEARLVDTEWMLDVLARRSDYPVGYSVYIVVRGHTEEAADERYQNVISKLRAKTREPLFRMDQAQKTLALCHGDALNHVLLMPAQSAAAGFPFCTRDLQQPDGVEFGVDSQDRTPVRLNRWRWKAPHSVTMGDTGSGKTYLQSLELLRTVQKHDEVRIVIVDPKPDYRPIISAMDGETYIVDAPVSDAEIDLHDVTSFEPAPGVDDKAELLVDVVSWIFDRTTADDRKTLVVVDEAHNLLEDEDGASVLSRFVREARSSNTAVSLLTQTVYEFLNGDVGETILANAEAKVFLQHDNVPVEAANQFRLSEGELGAVPMLKTGTEVDYSEALVQVGNELKATVEVRAKPTEREILESPPGGVHTVEQVSDHIPGNISDNGGGPAEAGEESGSERSDSGDVNPDAEEKHMQLRQLEDQIEARQRELQELDNTIHRRKQEHEETGGAAGHVLDLVQAMPPLPDDWDRRSQIEEGGPIVDAIEQIHADYYTEDGTWCFVAAARIPPSELVRLEEEPMDIATVNAWVVVGDVVIAAATEHGTKQNAGHLLWQSPLTEHDHTIHTYA